MRILVTGADGFAGRHLCALLRARGDEVVSVVGGEASAHSEPRHTARCVDVRDARAVHDVVADSRPEAVVHLAGVSSVAQSHAQPAATFDVNVMGTVHVCTAVRAINPKCRVLLISSGEVYGAVDPGRPCSEDHAVAPTSPYAASKLAAEAIGQQFFRSYGLQVICARAFNHVGRGQAGTFAIPSFARQLAEGRDADTSRTLLVGNLAAVRDFSHVDDVVSAYRLLLDRGIPGEIYNVCSGSGRSLQSVLDELISLAGVAVDVQIDPARSRPADLPWLVGSPAKLQALGWTTRSSVRAALGEVLAEYRS